MATKTEVLRLIGDREGVLEAELRRSMGNNPDTSKALRSQLHLYMLHVLPHRAVISIARLTTLDSYCKSNSVQQECEM